MVPPEATRRSQSAADNERGWIEDVNRCGEGLSQSMQRGGENVLSLSIPRLGEGHQFFGTEDSTARGFAVAMAHTRTRSKLLQGYADAAILRPSYHQLTERDGLAT